MGRGFLTKGKGRAAELAPLHLEGCEAKFQQKFFGELVPLFYKKNQGNDVKKKRKNLSS